MTAVFGSTTDEIQWVLTGYLLTTGVVIPMSGFLCDRWGHKKMYLLALISFTVGSAFCSLAWSTASMIAGPGNPGPGRRHADTYQHVGGL
jgi:MFS family permease